MLFIQVVQTLGRNSETETCKHVKIMIPDKYLMKTKTLSTPSIIDRHVANYHLWQAEPSAAVRKVMTSKVP